jgi:hypothetical protein
MAPRVTASSGLSSKDNDEGCAVTWASATDGTAIAACLEDVCSTVDTAVGNDLRACEVSLVLLTDAWALQERLVLRWCRQKRI